MKLKHLFYAIATLPLLFSCEPEVAVTGIAIDPSSVTLTEIGQEQTLTVTLAPEGAKGNVVWESSNTAVVTVEGSGLTAVITAVGKGTAKITASVGIFPAECNVVVSIESTGGDEGNGTEESPYNVAQAISFTGATPQVNDAWVGGYIVGGVIDDNNATTSLVTNPNGYVFDNTGIRNSYVLIADSPTETNSANVLVVKLTGESGTNAHTVPAGYQDVVNLVTKPCNLSEYLKVKGDIYAAFQVPGIRRVSDYKFTEKDCSTKTDPLHVSYNEGFEGFVAGTGNAYMKTQPDNKGWLDYSVQGTLLPDVRKYNDNNYVQFSAHRNSGVTSGDIQEMWIVSPRLDLNNASSKVVTFDINGGYFHASTIFKVYIIEGNDPTISAANKVELTNWTMPTLPASGYAPSWVNVGNISLTEYTGIRRIAFYYKGTSGSGNSTTIQLDDFKFAN